MATLNRTFSVKNGIDVANTIIIDSTRNLSNIATANATTVNATTFITTGGLNVTDQANNARDQANTARDQANSARDQANTGYGQANDAYSQANSARGQANTARDVANAAYNQANTSYLPSVTRLDVTNSGASAYRFDQYGSAVDDPTLYVRAGETIAFNLNNAGHPFAIRVSDGGANYDTGLTHVATDGTVSTGSSAQGKVAGTLYWKVPYALGGNTYVYQCTAHAGMVGDIVIEPPMVIAYAQANTARDTANGAYAQANGAYAQANTAYGQANDAYAQANTGYAQANAAYGQANAARDQANTAYGQANDAYSQANTARGTANDAYSQANTARDTANSAYAEANLKLNISGGTITGSLVVQGNLEILGNSTTLNVETLAVEDNEIILNSNVTGSPALDALITINRGTETNAVLKWDETSDQWKWADGEGTFYALDSALDAYAQANSGYAQANTARDTANDAYGQANTARTQANTAREQANTARDQANAAYGDANTRVLKAGDTMTGVLTISNSGIGLLVGNAAVTYELSVGSLNVTTNTVTTSATGQVVLDTFATTKHASAKYFVQVKSGSDYHTTEIVLVQDATNVWLTEYGSIQTGASLGSFSADINGGNARLLFNAENATNTIRAVRYGVAPP